MVHWAQGLCSGLTHTQCGVDCMRIICRELQWNILPRITCRLVPFHEGWALLSVPEDHTGWWHAHCGPSAHKPRGHNAGEIKHSGFLRLDRFLSWRPSFGCCDCSLRGKCLAAQITSRGLCVELRGDLLIGHHREDAMEVRGAADACELMSVCSSQW